MKKLPDSQTVQFCGKTQFQTCQQFADWVRLSQEITILDISFKEDKEDKETPFQLTLYYKV